MSTLGNGSSSTAVGAEDFLARFAPNISLKERSGLTSMVRAAVRDYMEENRLVQPPPPRMLAHMMQQQRPTSAMWSQDDGQLAAAPRTPGHRRPRTARADFPATSSEKAEAEVAAAEAAAAVAGSGDGFCLIGNATGILTDTPRYAMVSPKFAPTPASALAGGRESRGREFPNTLMGFSSHPEARLQDSIGVKAEDLMKDAATAAATAAATPAATAAAAVTITPAAAVAAGKPGKRPVTANNWLSWRATTPFCPSDRELRAFRHEQNPRKPMPGQLAHLAAFDRARQRGARPQTARGAAVGPERPVDRNIIDWVEGATEQEKQVALNLMKAIGSGRNQGLESFCLDGWRLETPTARYRPEGHTFGRRTRPPTPRAALRMPAAPIVAGKAEVKPTAMFPGIAADFSTARSRVNPLRPHVDYVNSGSGFTNAAPPYRSNFVVHPDWVSELAPPPIPVVRRK